MHPTRQLYIGISRKYEAYNHDGFSSRSPTSNYIDNSLMKSSNERDSTSSVRGQWLK